uniref:Uncharacterized protein n=1 Tax=Octopus bimaculoides TaxID=37653 RepID=A0A0L8FF42_OCTBM
MLVYSRSLSKKACQSLSSWTNRNILHKNTKGIQWMHVPKARILDVLLNTIHTNSDFQYHHMIQEVKKSLYSIVNGFLDIVAVSLSFSLNKNALIP